MSINPFYARHRENRRRNTIRSRVIRYYYYFFSFKYYFFSRLLRSWSASDNVTVIRRVDRSRVARYATRAVSASRYAPSARHTALVARNIFCRKVTLRKLLLRPGAYCLPYNAAAADVFFLLIKKKTHTKKKHSTPPHPQSHYAYSRQV